MSRLKNPILTVSRRRQALHRPFRPFRTVNYKSAILLRSLFLSVINFTGCSPQEAPESRSTDTSVALPTLNGSWKFDADGAIKIRVWNDSDKVAWVCTNALVYSYYITIFLNGSDIVQLGTMEIPYEALPTLGSTLHTRLQFQSWSLLVPKEMGLKLNYIDYVLKPESFDEYDIDVSNVDVARSTLEITMRILPVERIAQHDFPRTLGSDTKDITIKLTYKEE